MKMTSHRQSMLCFRVKGSNYEKLSILLIGSSDFCHSMSDTISTLGKKRKIQFTISIAESIEQILKSSVLPHIDVICFLMDTRERHCIEQVERNICLVEPSYLSDRMILINCCNHLGEAKLGLSYHELSNLSQKYRLQMIHGNIENEEIRENLAKRIIHFSVVVCGEKTGKQMFYDFPTFPFCEFQD